MSLFQDYEKEVRSGNYSPPLHEDSEKNLPPEPEPEPEPLPPIAAAENKWDIASIIIALALPVAGFFAGKYYQGEKEPQVITKEVIKEVPVPGKTRWRTKTRDVVKWKTKTRWRTREVPGPVRWRTKEVPGPERVIYRTDPATERKFNKLKAQYALRYKMLREFQESKLGPGESRKLTFSSTCPGFDNTIDIPTLRSYSQ